MSLSNDFFIDIDDIIFYLILKGHNKKPKLILWS